MLHGPQLRSKGKKTAVMFTSMDAETQKSVETEYADYSYTLSLIANLFHTLCYIESDSDFDTSGDNDDDAGGRGGWIKSKPKARDGINIRKEGKTVSLYQ